MKLHRHIYKPALGGTASTTLCNRVRNGQDYNVADTDDQVTCHYCRQILDGKVPSARLKYLNYQPA